MAEALDTSTGPSSAGGLSVTAETREFGGRQCTVVTLAGRADEAARPRLRAALQSYTRWGPPFVLIDLSAVQAIDVAPVREIVRVRSIMEGMGGVVALISPRPNVRDFLEACGVQDLVPVYPSVEAAMAG